jgi:hypothetical protein
MNDGGFLGERDFQATRIKEPKSKHRPSVLDFQRLPPSIYQKRDKPWLSTFDYNTVIET